MTAESEGRVRLTDAPELPREISPDGREVWAWADSLSAYTHWLHAKRQLREDISLNTGVCGSCDKWMKSRECPREKNVNGMSRGPSCKSLTCGQFVWAASSLRLIEEWKAKLAELEAQGPASRAALENNHDE